MQAQVHTQAAKKESSATMLRAEASFLMEAAGKLEPSHKGDGQAQSSWVSWGQAGILASTAFYRYCTPEASAPVVVINESPM